MTFNEYQELAKQTAIYPKDRGIDYTIHGLMSEAGEVAGKWKKVLRDNNAVLTDVKREELKKEVGDCIWYISQILTEIGSDFDSCAKENIDKLFSRKERGKISGSGDER